MSKNGYMVISLDFELVWGVFDVVDYKTTINYFNNTRKVIPSILAKFKEDKIHATWAVVGMLFNKNWEEWTLNRPVALPFYSNSKLSAYDFGNSIISTDFEELFFAPELINEIKNAPGQEVGTHTYSHYYCLEAGQDIEEFRADLAKAVEMAGKFNIDLKSLVFPRNQIKQEYLQICKEFGIQTVRSNPSTWYWKDTLSEAFFTKVARSGDAYLPFGKKTYSKDDIVQKNGLPLEQKASRFLRPVEGNYKLRKLKLKRIKDEITVAAKKKEVYHLWWHPHNFGDQPGESLKDLGDILEHFNVCRNKYGIQSVSMHELHDIIAKKKSLE